jgi:hypothetical protein
MLSVFSSSVNAVATPTKKNTFDQGSNRGEESGDSDDYMPTGMATNYEVFVVSHADVSTPFNEPSPKQDGGESRPNWVILPVNPIRKVK